MRYANEVPRDDLYIPHGSDERGEGMSVSVAIAIFISHMVQMKEAYQVTLFRPSHHALYPTWFR